MVEVPNLNELMEILHNRGWQVSPSLSREPLLPRKVEQRYPILPDIVTDFLKTFESCFNPNKTVWFLTREDYCRVSEDTFRWNEQEMMSLEAARDDPTLQTEITAFWDQHFPFMFSVHSDYDYLAVELKQESYGCIVHGCAPEWEETSVVSPTFSHFLDMFKEALLGKATYPLTYFI